MTSERKEKALKALAAYTRKITRTKSSARSALVREGIYTREGKLTAEYGGPGTKKTSAGN